MANPNETSIPSLPSEAELTTALRMSLAKKFGMNSNVGYDSDYAFQDEFVGQNYHSKNDIEKREALVEALRKSEGLTKAQGWNNDIAARYEKLNHNSEVSTDAKLIAGMGSAITAAGSGITGARDFYDKIAPEQIGGHLFTRGAKQVVDAANDYYSKSPQVSTPSTDDIVAMTKFNMSKSADPAVYQDGAFSIANGDSKPWSSAADKQTAAIKAFQLSMGEKNPNGVWSSTEEHAFLASKDQQVAVLKRDPTYKDDIAFNPKIAHAALAAVSSSGHTVIAHNPSSGHAVIAHNPLPEHSHNSTPSHVTATSSETLSKPVNNASTAKVASAPTAPAVHATTVSASVSSHSDPAPHIKMATAVRQAQDSDAIAGIKAEFVDKKTDVWEKALDKVILTENGKHKLSEADIIANLPKYRQEAIAMVDSTVKAAVTPAAPKVLSGSATRGING